MEHLEGFADHLEFLGYVVERKDAKLFCRHSRHLSLFVKRMGGGVLLTSFFGVSPDWRDETLVVLEWVNELNRSAVVCRFLLDDDGDFCIEAWFSGMYSKSHFAVFLDALHHDHELVRKHESSSRLLE